ncbi:Pseudouridine synthase [hydrothermal vent metagenome]|uniref:Pseudouridine synthase n=1 Tax=hydrothermal vent metagenome TaxID=652676 RepID=A0A3B0VZU2_9ZZZZ
MTQSHKQHIQLPITTDGVSALEHLYQAVHTDSSLPSISKQMLKNYALKGGVWLSPFNHQSNKPQKNERLRRLKKILSSNDLIDFYYDPKLLNSEPSPPTLIADFKQYSVWLKPRGMLSQGSKWADHTALYRWIEMHYQPNHQNRPCWIVHRLDRATCGLMLVAHNKKMATALSQLFEQGRINKCYQANVWGVFPSTPQTFTALVQEKPAISHATLLKIFSPPSSITPISRVNIVIETGRKHQIRTHLSQAGYPIVGDRLYGGGENLQQLSPIPDLQLTAYQLNFECPVTKKQQHFCLSESQLNLHDFYSEKG